MSNLPDATCFYINGQWCEPKGNEYAPLINPATEKEIGRVSLGNAEDADRAISAAKNAFDHYSQSTIAERIDLLKAINDQLIKRKSDIAEAVHQTMGAPKGLAGSAQAGSGPQHFGQIVKN